MNNEIFVNTFTFKVQNENTKWVIPVTTVENTDGITISSNWTKQHLQGGTEPIVAFNYVDNPTITINLKFHEDLWREYPNYATGTYESAIAKLASLQYPSGANTIESPYVYIAFNNKAYRGYFQNMKITQSGPIRDGHRIVCDVSGSFVIVKSSSPQKSGVASGFNNYFAN